MRNSVLIVVLALIPVSFAHAQIPTAERDALFALYNSTDGANWSDSTGWLGTAGTECTWYGVTCDGGQVTSVDLGANELNGSIPPELGDLSGLLSLFLFANQLSGSIPAELGDLSSLQYLSLNSNRLSGDIPAELNLGNLPALRDGGSDFRWNAVHTDNLTLIAFLTLKQKDGGDWQSTQTIAPENLMVDSLGDHTVWLSWDAVAYVADPGGYSVFSTPTGTGVWTTSGIGSRSPAPRRARRLVQCG